MWVEGRGLLPGRLIVVSGPSGSGKSTLIRRVLDRVGDRLMLSVSATTRAPRSGEREGIDYYFMSTQEFLEVRNERFLEWAEYNGNFYGTPAEPVYEALAAGKCVVLEIEVEGAKQVREVVPEALFLFIKTLSFAILANRLRARGTETESVVHIRLRRARQELDEAHRYDIVLTNDDLDRCVEEFINVLKPYGCGG